MHCFWTSNLVTTFIALAGSWIILHASADTCEDLQSSSLLSSQIPAMTLEEAGYDLTFNGSPLQQVVGTDIPVGSTYTFDISHSDATIMQRGLLEFEIDWSSMKHTYTYNALQAINGTLRVIGENSIRVTVGISSAVDEDNNINDERCITYSSGPYSFQVVPTNETLTLDPENTHHACNICGYPNAEASSTLVLHPDYSIEQPCEEWQTDGVNGRLTPEACQFLFRFPAVAAVCSCRHTNGKEDNDDSSATRAKSGFKLNYYYVFATGILGFVDLV